MLHIISSIVLYDRYSWKKGTHIVHIIITIIFKFSKILLFSFH